MSLARLVYYSSVISGWAAFFGWLLAECLVVQGEKFPGLLATLVLGTSVGAAIGAGLNLVVGMANASLTQLVQQIAKRVPLGLLVGGLGGLVGSLVGWAVFEMGLPRAFGFLFLGLGVGVAEGLSERSKAKILNGLVGGAVGGLIGGFLFDPIYRAMQSDACIASRATAFVILGLCIGALVGMVQVVLKKAWLTVMDGHGVGRQHILGAGVTYLGRGDHLPMPFRGRQNSKLEDEHVKIVKQADGSYSVEDNSSQLGVSVRGAEERGYQSLTQPRILQNKDEIRFGGNVVRFNQRGKTAGPDEEVEPPPTRPSAPPRPPSPPSPKTKDAPKTSKRSASQQSEADLRKGASQRKPGVKPPPPPPPPGKKRS